MKKSEHWFTYSLCRGDNVVRKGKGVVREQRPALIQNYLKRRYGKGWSASSFAWHTSESAALKHEMRSIDDFSLKEGHLPAWNKHRGGGGARRYARCRDCRNSALEGNFGFCALHRTPAPLPTPLRRLRRTRTRSSR